ncbi:uncharacterized protein LY79DRAFT_151278 [Colletotrichum navitas]|uniref:Uncharacterized protein n=1 Tax=Colletotrichum navitas TaxID=681940 RepID=A0AAD8QCC2_9PEZI|nr:uncharacterized protein LY79DRAFT_151278 [Colletotrichum navitas]KAK1599770.1 hypothetical protein LY79DRAFT_151278 [Colletotrichum navitas]
MPRRRVPVAKPHAQGLVARRLAKAPLEYLPLTDGHRTFHNQGLLLPSSAAGGLLLPLNAPGAPVNAWAPFRVKGPRYGGTWAHTYLLLLAISYIHITHPVVAATSNHFSSNLPYFSPPFPTRPLSCFFTPRFQLQTTLQGFTPQLQKQTPTIPSSTLTLVAISTSP